MTSGPKELSECVHKKLRTIKGGSLPSLSTLHTLFDTLFYASIKTEESEFVKVTVTLIDVGNLDPTPPRRIVAHRWNYVPLKEEIPFTVKNLVKLSKAVDTWSSSLAVYYNTENELFISGLIDQAIHYQSFLNYESDSGPEQPGLFQSSITGVGSLVVMLNYELLATLKQDILITNYIDVLTKGPVHDQLQINFRPIKTKIKSFIDKQFPLDADFFDDYFVEGLCIETLSRILLRIQNYKHGGALLITDSHQTGLDTKYKVPYDRLNRSIIDVLKLTIKNSNIYQHIDYTYVENGQAIPVSDYLDEHICMFDKDETKDELKGAIRFISSLSCVDGLVMLTTDLRLKGFGVVIKTKELPSQIYVSKVPGINHNRLIKVNPNSYGTRHRSMFSYCWSNPGSIGFVVSQDGDIRAVTTVGKKLIMWENIKVQRLLEYRPPKRSNIVSSSLAKSSKG